MNTTPTRPAWVTDRHEAAAVLARRTVLEGSLHPAVKRPDDPGLAAFFEATIELAGHALIELDRATEYDQSRAAVVGSQLVAVSMAQAFGEADQQRMRALMPSSYPELARVAASLAGIVAQLVTAREPGEETDSYQAMRALLIDNDGKTPEENGDDN